MNRDERHDRAPEQPPQEIAEGIFAPLDPVSSGTWIAHNKAGYWGCILNGYFEAEQPKNLKSRGNILPELLSKQNPLGHLGDINPKDYPSFRLVIGSPVTAKLYIWDGRDFAQKDFYAHHNDASFVTSSSLKQDAVIAHRKALFQNHTGAMLDFHKISDNPEIDPLMHRSYSRTKSITVMNISQQGGKMDYFDALTINPRTAR